MLRRRFDAPLVPAPALAPAPASMTGPEERKEIEGGTEVGTYGQTTEGDTDAHGLYATRL